MTTNYEHAFADRPEVYAAWVDLNGAFKAGMDPRRSELVTLAAARRLRSSHCCLAYGNLRQERFGESVLESVRDHRAAASYHEMGPQVRAALVVGRPIADA